MNDQIDQFGRDKSKTSLNFINDEKSKKILESLTEIKFQLENKDHVLKEAIKDTPSNMEKRISISNDSEFDQLYKKIEYLEKKLKDLTNQFEMRDSDKTNNIRIEKNREKSIFHNFNNENEQDQGRSLLVLEKQNQSKLYKFKFYHFLLLTSIILVILILLMSFQLRLNFFEVINLFLLQFN